MPRNRFENYIGNQYQSQFTPTPLDANLAFNTINARQGYYDNIQAALAKSNPQLDYLAPNQFDQGDMQPAYELMNERAKQIESITGDIYKTDNLTDAARKIAALQNDPNYNQKVQALRNRKLQDEQYRKTLQDNYGKDPFFNQYLSNYEKSRYSEFSPTSSLNSPIGALTPDSSKLLKDITSMMESDSWQTADGSMVGKSADGQFYITRKGKTERIDYKQAMQEASAFVYGDPTVQNWLSVMDRMGINGKAMLDSQIMGAASAKAFNKSESEIGYIEDGFARDANKKKIDTPTESVLNPWGAFDSNSVAPLMVDSNGEIVVNIEDPEYQRLKKEASIVRARGNSPSSKAIQAEIKAQQEFNNYSRNKYQEEIAKIKEQYPGMSNEAIVNMLNQAASGQMYMEQLKDPDTGNPIDGNKVPIQQFSGRTIYEVGATGPEEVKWEDVVEEASKKENTLGEGNVFQNGINIMVTNPKPDSKTPDKKQSEFYSGVPFSIGNKKYIAAENSTEQKAKRKEFNRLFSLENDLNRKYDLGIIENQQYMSYRIADKPTGSYIVRALPVENGDEVVNLILPDGSKIDIPHSEINNNPEIEKLFSTYGLPKEVVNQLIEK